MIKKTTRLQKGSPVVEGGGEGRRWGRGEGIERRLVRARSMLELTAPKARSRSREVVTLDEAQRISSMIRCSLF